MGPRGKERLPLGTRNRSYIERKGTRLPRSPPISRSPHWSRLPDFNMDEVYGSDLRSYHDGIGITSCLSSFFRQLPFQTKPAWAKADVAGRGLLVVEGHPFVAQTEGPTNGSPELSRWSVNIHVRFRRELFSIPPNLLSAAESLQLTDLMLSSSALVWHDPSCTFLRLQVAKHRLMMELKMKHAPNEHQLAPSKPASPFPLQYCVHTVILFETVWDWFEYLQSCFKVKNKSGKTRYDNYSRTSLE